MDFLLAITLVSLAVFTAAGIGRIVHSPAASGPELTVAELQARLAAEHPGSNIPIIRRG
ncbi:hypothetical protein ABZ319_00545 [Nocardia sp. NPDC005978]|uniref:hypothetical protein n=1 Tax=Nocardia sp. NPDC005978 TaxID=3156725 RepID=UPI0033BD7CFD